MGSILKLLIILFGGCLVWWWCWTIGHRWKYNMEGNFFYAIIEWTLYCLRLFLVLHPFRLAYHQHLRQIICSFLYHFLRFDYRWIISLHFYKFFSCFQIDCSREVSSRRTICTLSQLLVNFIVLSSSAKMCCNAGLKCRKLKSTDVKFARKGWRELCIMFSACSRKLIALLKGWRWWQILTMSLTLLKYLSTHFRPSYTLLAASSQPWPCWKCILSFLLPFLSLFTKIPSK